MKRSVYTINSHEIFFYSFLFFYIHCIKHLSVYIHNKFYVQLIF